MGNYHIARERGYSLTSQQERRIKLDSAVESRKVGKDLIIKWNQVKKSSFSRNELETGALCTW